MFTTLLQNWEIFFYIYHFAPAIDLLSQADFTSVIIGPQSNVTEYFKKKFDVVILDIQDTTESLVFSIQKCTRYIASFEDLLNLVFIFIEGFFHHV